MEKIQHCTHSQKSDKQNSKNYCPLTLLPICGKFYGRLSLIKCLAFFSLVNLFHLINPASNLDIIISTKCYQLPMTFFKYINWQNLVTSRFAVQNIYSKTHPFSCTNTHHDVTDLVNHGMVKNIKKNILRMEQLFYEIKKS